MDSGKCSHEVSAQLADTIKKPNEINTIARHHAFDYTITHACDILSPRIRNEANNCLEADELLSVITLAATGPAGAAASFSGLDFVGDADADGRGGAWGPSDLQRVRYPSAGVGVTEEIESGR